MWQLLGLAACFVAAILLVPGTLALRLVASCGIAGLAAFGLALEMARRRQKHEIDHLTKNLATVRESAQIQLKSATQELAKHREKDVDSRKAVEAQLAQFNQLDYIINNLPAGLLVASSDGAVQWANNGLERLTGWPLKEIAGRDWSQVFKDPLGGKEENRITKLEGKNTADIDQDKVYCRNGQELNVSSFLWRFAQDGRIGWLFVPKGQAMDYNRLRDEFVTNISHELRTPLTVIKGYTEILHEEAKDANSPSLEFLSVILQQSDRLNGLLESILNFREASSGLIGLRQEKIDVLLLINTVIRDQEHKAAAKGITITRQVPESMAPGKGDFSALRFAFDHILDNAVKFSPRGSAVRVEVGDLRLVDTSWKQEIRIIDNGPGIAPQDLPHIFEKFYRTDQKVHTLVGTGIGLSSAKEIIENVGGDITVDSVPGKGSTFTVQIPVAE